MTLTLSPEILTKIPFSENKIENIYLVGSRLWETANPTSDYDFLITTEQYEGPATIHGINFDLVILTTNEFQQRVDNHEFIETMAIYSPPAWRSEKRTPRIPIFNPLKWQEIILYRMNRDIAYANKNEEKGKIDRASKTRFHALVTLQMGIELLVAKKLQQPYPVFINNRKYKKSIWTKTTFEPIYTKLLGEFNQIVMETRVFEINQLYKG